HHRTRDASDRAMERQLRFRRGARKPPRCPGDGNAVRCPVDTQRRCGSSQPRGGHALERTLGTRGGGACHRLEPV
ncbi:unnamed protein product, partial [Ascophyllum nodosum]